MQRWITVANRLPFSVSSDKQKVTTSSGGLVSALSGVRTKGERIWVGCAPDNVTAEDWPQLEKKISANANSSGGWKFHPVFAPPELYDAYYNGCCNDVLWPLLHYQPELVQFDTETWKAYQEMNERIAHEIAAIAQPDDLIWIHDYHLFLAPKILKKLRPELRVGFFLHVPFPSSELFRQLPAREEILSSLLEADLLGFHDYSYLQHFCSSVLRVLGVEAQFLSITRGNKTTRLGVFPVSIDTDHFARRSKDAKVKALAKEFLKPTFLFLGVDRLDYMKGIDLKLRAFQRLLTLFPEFREQTTLLQVAVPTRTGVPVYNELARETARLVGEINGQFSTPNWTPVQYIHASVNFDQLIALYKAADALLVSSKRDGMNLVALEYIASQDTERPGVVLLSEFTGAISTLSHTLPVNPWDIEDSARKMKKAMEMSPHERLYRVQTMQEYLRKYTSTDWAVSFIAELSRPLPERRQVGPRPISTSDESISMVCDRLLAQNPKRVTLFIDFDGTLVPIAARPEDATLPASTKKELQRLTRHSWLDLVIVSGRDARFLEEQFEGLRVHLAAEHGAKSYDPNDGRWHRHVHRSRSNWFPAATKIMTDYAARVPHSRVEKKHYAIAWHYRLSPQDYGELQARKLAEELELGLANLPVNILRGKKVIEVRAIEANKGVFASAFLEAVAKDTVALAVGDDKTDEDLFLSVRSRGVSVHVGQEPSVADAALASQSQVLPFLTAIVAKLGERLRSPASTRKESPVPLDL